MPQGVRMVIITGMSGAGKTVAVQSLEDLGFFCVDNLPPALIPKFGELVRQSAGNVPRVGLVCDLRGGEFFGALSDSLRELEQHSGIEYQILFLEADDDTLVRRYKASRRKHPLAPANGRVVDGIARERKMLEEIRSRADRVLNTSRLRPIDLREIMAKHFRGAEKPADMTVSIISFGFKYGLPIDADLVFDVRFLPNPYYIDALRPRTGQDAQVFEYVMKWPVAEGFMHRLHEMVDFLLPEYAKEGKSQVVIGIGCTGGRHRSVAVAEGLREHLQRAVPVSVLHRDIGKDEER